MTSNRPYKVAIRVDSGTLLGSGHVVRCLSLAGEVSKRGARVHFVCRELAGNLIERIERQGYPVARLPAPQVGANAVQWFEVPHDQDASETRAVLERLRPDWLVIDHYGVDSQWQNIQRAAVGRIFVIDDLADRRHDCDLLLDQNYFGSATASRYTGLVSDHCRTLLGPRYALLQREYSCLHTVPVPRNSEARRVLVYFGGSDTTDQTSKALQALSIAEFAGLAVDVVLGSNHPNPLAVQALVAQRPHTMLHRELRSLVGVMYRSDLVIGAGGATTWERLCLGLPSVVITLAANQEQLTASLAEEELVVWAGGVSISVDTLIAAIRLALNRPVKMHPLVDGYGLARVVAVLVPPPPSSLYLTRATQDDAEIFFDWRNEVSTRAMSFDEKPIDWETHTQWFGRKLQDANVEMFVARANDLPIGQARIDFVGDQAVLSYGIDPVVRGQGFGKALVEQVVRKVSRIPVSGFRAHVKAENLPSRRIFEQLGWQTNLDGKNFIFTRSGGRLE